jgi:large subunit ribosomal protein L3
MKFILGKKLGMTQVWKGDKVIAVTPVLATPCVVSQVKNKETDGYEALQVASGTRKEKNIKKPQLGHFKATGVKPSHVREFRLEKTEGFKAGDVISVETFAEGDVINVTGTSKGKGFQGVVKRHGFAGFRKTHGNKDQERMPGSIGPKGPAHVFKGTRMGGRMGGERVTTTNLEIVSVNPEENTIYVKGSVPGAINGLVMITSKGELQVNLKKAPEVISEAVSEEVKEVIESTPETEVQAEEVATETTAEASVEEVKEEVKEEVPEAVAEEVKEEAKA